MTISTTSRIGRKSVFARELSELQEPSNTIKSGPLVENEVIGGVVLDICASYKQESIFIDDKYRGYKNFKTGIFFIIGLFEDGEIAVVSWRKSEDELRSLYGTDDNIIGRECTLICKKKTPDAYLKGEILFNYSLSSGIKSFKGSEYISNSFFSNTPTNFADQLKGANLNSGFGETWRKVDLK